MQSALGYIPLHPPPLEVGTPCTPEMAALTRQHAPHPPALPVEVGTLCMPDMFPPPQHWRVHGTGSYAIQQVASRVSQTRLP